MGNIATSGAGATGAVVVGVDGSVPSEEALRCGCAEAGRRGVDVVAVYVAPAYVTSDWGVKVSSQDAQAEHLLEHFVGRVAPAGVTVHCIVRVAPPVLSLRAEALRHDACMLVVGRRGAGGMRRLVVGSVSSGLAQNPVRPLVIVPSRDDGPARHGGGGVLVGIDGSAPSLAALAWAAGEAARRHTVAEVVLAWSFPHLDVLPFLPPTHDNVKVLHDRARTSLEHELDQLPADLRRCVEPRLRKGDPAEVLLRMAARADLVVVGTRGQGFLRQHVLGSTSHALLQHCKVPLAIIPSGPHADPEGAGAGAEDQGRPALQPV